MSRKKKHEEHENLERWLVSYADFMTLLFATFVVLYALSQTDVSKFTKLGESLKGSFSQSVLEGSQGVLDSKGQSVLDSNSADSMMSSLIFEYLNPKYEAASYEDIQKQITDLNKSGELEGVSASVQDRGLVIVMSDKTLKFKEGSAELSPEAKLQLDKIGGIIGKKFILHLMRIEGHTDNIPFSSVKYPSNWELSSARSSAVTRYLIERFKFTPDLFTVVGFADTRPLVPNTSKKNRALNRRVDIVVLRNQFKPLEDSRDSLIKFDKKSQQKQKEEQAQTIQRVLNLSDAAKQLTGDDLDSAEKVIRLDKSPSQQATY